MKRGIDEMMRTAWQWELALGAERGFPMSRMGAGDECAG